MAVAVLGEVHLGVGRKPVTVELSGRLILRLLGRRVRVLSNFLKCRESRSKWSKAVYDAYGPTHR